MQIQKGIKYFEAPSFKTLKEMLDYVYEKYPSRDAVVFRNKPDDPEPQRRTYRELYDNVHKLRRTLAHHGECGGRIAVLGDNSYPWLLTYLAAVNGGGVMVPLDRLLPGEELSNLLIRGEVTTLVLDASMMESLRPYIKNCKNVKRWIGMQTQRLRKLKERDDFREEVTLCGAEYLDFDELMDEEIPDDAGSEPYFPEDNEMAVLLFTSGTTASSKAVMLSNGNLVADMRALIETVKFKDPLKSLSLLPLHHTFENTCGFLTVLSIGGCIHIYDGLRYIARNIEEYHVHMVIGVPTVFEMIYRRIMQKVEKEGKQKRLNFGRRLSKFLRFFGIDMRRRIFKEILDGLGGEFYIAISGAANLDKKIIDFFSEIGIEILQGYGMTETAPVVAGCNTQYNVHGTCGQALSGVTLAIDTDIPGEAGEILIKGDMVMLGYYQNEEDTREALSEDGWLHTGDIGYIDPKNDCLVLTGRTKSMIVLPSGKKVFPEELESLLNQNDLVKDSLVFGQEDANGDIVLTAKIVIDQDRLESEGEAPDPEFIRKTIEEYIEKANEVLPSFKGIRSYAYSFQDMVKTTTLKVKRSVETERIKETIARAKLGWRELIGQNLDQLEMKIKEQQLESPEQLHEEAAAITAEKDMKELSMRELLELEALQIKEHAASKQNTQLFYEKQRMENELQKERDVRNKRSAEKLESKLLHAEYRKKLKNLRDRYELEIHEIKRRAKKEAAALELECGERMLDLQNTMEEKLENINASLAKLREDDPEAMREEETALRNEIEKHSRESAQKLAEEKKRFRRRMKSERYRQHQASRKQAWAEKKRIREEKKAYAKAKQEEKKRLKAELDQDKLLLEENKRLAKQSQDEVRKSSKAMRNK